MPKWLPYVVEEHMDKWYLGLNRKQKLMAFFGYMEMLTVEASMLTKDTTVMPLPMRMDLIKAAENLSLMEAD
jgi:hypothetical protein